jgi:aspartyl aminopeptidase
METNLLKEKKNAWTVIDEAEKARAFEIGSDYLNFLDAAKTERESVLVVEKKAIENGYISIEKVINEKLELTPGMKIYANNRDKTIALFVIGKSDLEAGMNIVGAHVDVPRLDLKANPLYEKDEIAFLKTHYYGGIRKYQWLAIPLAIHGVVMISDGTKVNITLGEADDEPVFFITDLLPHLSKDQNKKTLSDAITGEELNLIIGGIPTDNPDAKEKVKYAIMEKLNKMYGMTEADFMSAELEVVPAFKAKYVGLDKAFIAGYGHDDRVCSYAAYQSIFDMTEVPERTAVALLVDKEEVGSQGNSGMQSRFFENCVAELIAIQSKELVELKVRRSFKNSKVLSADVAAAYDPDFASVLERNNAAFAGHGLVVTKYTGSRGKSGCNDANAEFNYEVCKTFTDAGVTWQTAELGKVDQGGGGTIAYILANLDAEVIDCGVAVFAMHAPYELISTVDLYMAYKGYKAFYHI